MKKLTKKVEKQNKKINLYRLENICPNIFCS